MSKLSPIQQAERRAILRNTAILGVSLGIFQGIVWITSSPLLFLPFTSAFLFLVAPLVWIIALLIHGILVGKRTGDHSQATLTCVVGGILGGLIASMFHIFSLALSFDNTGSDQLTFISGETMSFILAALCITFFAGGIFGLLGGYIGKYISSEVAQPKAFASSQARMYYYPPVAQTPQYYPPVPQAQSEPEPQSSPSMPKE